MTEHKSFSHATVYEFTLRGTVCGEILTTETIREAMELWAAQDLYRRDVVYGTETVTVNGVTWGVRVKP